MKNKEQLEQEIVELEARIGANDRLQELAKVELTTSKQKLADVSKIVLPAEYFDKMYQAISWGIEAFDFSDTDNYDKEFTIGYDNQIELENLELKDTSELADEIMKKVATLFVDASEES
jgi:hypothetical protein